LRSLEPDKVCKLSSLFSPTLYNTGYMWSLLQSAMDCLRVNVDFNT
jgi:hypothetical protein